MTICTVCDNAQTFVSSRVLSTYWMPLRLLRTIMTNCTVCDNAQTLMSSRVLSTYWKPLSLLRTIMTNYIVCDNAQTPVSSCVLSTYWKPLRILRTIMTNWTVCENAQTLQRSACMYRCPYNYLCFLFHKCIVLFQILISTLICLKDINIFHPVNGYVNCGDDYVLISVV